MKHLGDITKINGAEIEPVDCITGGSPCQDLSVAGKRAGLAGERSGLFMEQIRIVKEMREHERRIRGTDDDFRLRPRYMVWENVPGAFSSNKGQDFQAVLTEIVRIVRPDAPDVPLPDRGGWSKSGCIMGYGSTGCPFSIAWRLHDAQFWGVPQRRKRIALVADFGGLSASEVLFERKGLSGDFAESGTQGQRTSESTERSTDNTIGFNRERSGAVTANGIMPTLQAAAVESGNNKPMVVCLQGNGIDRADTAGCNGKGWNDENVSYTLNTIDRPAVAVLNDQGGSVMGISEDVTGALRAETHGHEPILFEPRSQDGVPRIHGTTAPTLNTAQGGQRQPCVVTMNPRPQSMVCGEEKAATLGADDYKEPQVVCIGNGQADQTRISDKVGALNCMHDQQAIMTYQEKTGTVDACIGNGTSNQPTTDMFVANYSAVRRLTPLECERLQGYPDGWTDIGEWVDSKGKKHKESDSPRYKALGNSIAVGYANNGSGFWMWLLKRISAQYERNATLGSLFDGIGGFPLAWEHFNGKGSARWASEIEEFPIAVTKKHFPEDLL